MEQNSFNHLKTNKRMGNANSQCTQRGLGRWGIHFLEITIFHAGTNDVSGTSVDFRVSFYAVARRADWIWERMIINEALNAF